MGTCLQVKAGKLGEHGVDALGAPLVARIPHRLRALVGASEAQRAGRVHEQRLHVAHDDRQHVAVEDGGAHQRRRHHAEHGRHHQEKERRRSKRLEHRRGKRDQRSGCAGAVARGVGHHAPQAAVRKHGSQAQQRPGARRKDLQRHASDERCASTRSAGHNAHHRQAAGHRRRDSRRHRRNAARRHSARSGADCQQLATKRPCPTLQKFQLRAPPPRQNGERGRAAGSAGPGLRCSVRRCGKVRRARRSLRRPMHACALLRSAPRFGAGKPVCATQHMPLLRLTGLDMPHGPLSTPHRLTRVSRAAAAALRAALRRATSLPLRAPRRRCCPTSARASSRRTSAPPPQQPPLRRLRRHAPRHAKIGRAHV